MIYRSRVEKPPFERLRRLYAGAVGMAPEQPEMLPLSVPRHAVGVDVAELEDMEAAVHAARARAAVAGALRREVRALGDIGAAMREMAWACAHLDVEGADRAEADVMSAIARREALR